MPLTWTELFPAAQAASRRHSMATDTHRHRVVYLGANDFGDDTGRVQEWDGSTWSVMGTRPGDGFGTWKSCAYDRIRQEVVAFGGTDLSGNATDNTHVCGAAGTWSLLSPANAPSARWAAYMAWVEALAAVVLFGGSGPGPSFTALGDWWKWDGTDWTEIFPATSLSARYGSQGSNQAASLGDGMILYSDSTGLHDTAIFDGTDVTIQSPLTVPALSSPSLSWHPVRQSVILLGLAGGVHLTYEWPLGSSDWFPVATIDPPSDGLWQATAYDDNLAKIIAAGANAPGGATNPETWELDFAIQRAIHHTFGMGR